MIDYGNNVTWKRLWGGRKLFFNHPEKLFLYPTIKKCAPYSMLNYASFCQVHDALETLKQENIEGCVVETGCWKGGCGAFMALSGRRTFLLDSFEGLPGLTAKDQNKVSEEDATGLFPSSIYDVERIAATLGVRVEVIKGWFSESIPANKERMGTIALLRLDGDTYQSTKDALHLYDSVVEGGFVIIDDYKGWPGCRRAIHEFIYEKDINPVIQFYPYGGKAYFRKSI